MSKKKPEFLEQFVSASDHEDWENEYYARKSSGGLAGCLFLGAGLALTVIAAIVHWLFF